MPFVVKKFINEPINSNCFVIYNPETRGNCLVVDPGSRNAEALLAFLAAKNIVPEYIIITHEHFDHIAGVNLLKDTFNSKIICTEKCSEKIVDKKKNMSLFFDQVGFETYPADITVEQLDYQLHWQDITIKFILTPGHTDCCMTLSMNNELFVGDLMIKGEKTVTKLPTGNRQELIKSLNLLLDKYAAKNVKVYSGHGENFYLNQVDLKSFLEI